MTRTLSTPFTATLLLAALLAPPPTLAQTPGELFLSGYAHLTGQNDTPRDATRAARDFLEAARQGEPQAQYQLGVMYSDGLGLPRDTLWARFWLAKAAASPSLPQDARQAAKARLEALDKALTDSERRRLGLQ